MYKILFEVNEVFLNCETFVDFLFEFQIIFEFVFELVVEDVLQMIRVGCES